MYSRQSATCVKCNAPRDIRATTGMCRKCALPSADPKPCRTCGKDVKHVNYCSPECSEAGRVARAPKCLQCGAPRRGSRKTCSDECATARMQGMAEALSRVGVRTPEQRKKYRKQESTRYKGKDKAAVIEALTLEQEGKCAICEEVKPLFLDHDHVTNEPRLMLCRTCNIAEGVVYGDERIVLGLLAYVRACKCA